MRRILEHLAAPVRSPLVHQHLRRVGRQPVLHQIAAQVEVDVGQGRLRRGVGHVTVLHFVRIGHQRLDLVELLDDEVVDLGGRRAGDVQIVQIRRGFRAERHVAEHAHQREVIVRTQEARFADLLQALCGLLGGFVLGDVAVRELHELVGGIDAGVEHAPRVVERRGGVGVVGHFTRRGRARDGDVGRCLHADRDEGAPGVLVVEVGVDAGQHLLADRRILVSQLLVVHLAAGRDVELAARSAEQQGRQYGNKVFFHGRVHLAD